MNFRQLIEHDQDRFNDFRNISKDLKKFDTDFLNNYCYKSSFQYNVMILSLYGNLNVGTIIRTCNLMGCRNVIIFGRRKYDQRSAVGSHKYTNIIFKDGFIKERRDSIKHEDFELNAQKFYECFIENNCIPVFIEQHKDAIFLENVNWKLQHSDKGCDKPFCFVFGNEGEGIPDELIKIGLTIPGSFVISIRQVGVIKSLNVSSACSMILSNYFNYETKKIKDKYDI
jgi:tRNA G18 (ribose-2'-O)-methylase SpoU